MVNPKNKLILFFYLVLIKLWNWISKILMLGLAKEMH